MCHPTPFDNLVFQEEPSWYDYIENMMNGDEFKARFGICLDEEEYGEDTIVSNEPYIILKNNKCICCSRWIEDLRDDYFIINNDGNGITYSSILFQMVYGNFICRCNHAFLEGIKQICDTNVYELQFGS